jgi:hypothetical protein
MHSRMAPTAGKVNPTLISCRHSSLKSIAENNYFAAS